ncbi:NADH-quinone oxidoreductase subunit C [Yinghuangia sp. ASG 101]|uniref:NADH-quinone oxidoreductase subunit C n=1 Tax=Yinghuangia sp. ASG 101 TaxID=2896848 RepID=UPI001E471D11|nr:NADH-quinone oxidoreductase subunit C [Yinghuangia sp. ASG 101]UGQ14672.1 NADH-quinone oxidoreductase subunit C [Yinghuangia sp. ASG 101]
MTPDEIRAALGDGVTVTDAYGLATADVPAARWTAALTAARDVLGLGFLDWLGGVDEAPEGFAVLAHVCAAPGPRLLLRTRLPRATPHLATATGVYAGAAWHERETAEMFGIVFDDHPDPAPLLLPDGFEGHPLRKDFVLASRVAKAWPGAKDPADSDRSPTRRKSLPPGVPDPAAWGPEAPRPADRARPAAPRPTDAPDKPRDRPRRTRRASEGSASQREPENGITEPSTRPGEAPTPGPPTPDRPRRTRRASDGSASQRESGGGPTEPRTSTEPDTAPGPAPRPPSDGPRRTRRASDGSASQRRSARSPDPGARPGADDATDASREAASPDSPEPDRRPPSSPPPDEPPSPEDA